MRIGIDTWGMTLAAACAMRGTCARRQVGCVLVSDDKFVLATGYNGVAAGMAHCNEGAPCRGAQRPSGTGLDECEAIHAEQNALLQCSDQHAIHTCYTTTSPCIHCVKLLLNTSCKRIVFTSEYPQPKARELWERAGREWVPHDPEIVIQIAGNLDVILGRRARGGGGEGQGATAEQSEGFGSPFWEMNSVVKRVVDEDLNKLIEELFDRKYKGATDRLPPFLSFS